MASEVYAEQCLGEHLQAVPGEDRDVLEVPTHQLSVEDTV